MAPNLAPSAGAGRQCAAVTLASATAHRMARHVRLGERRCRFEMLLGGFEAMARDACHALLGFSRQVIGVARSGACVRPPTSPPGGECRRSRGRVLSPETCPSALRGISPNAHFAVCAEGHSAIVEDARSRLDFHRTFTVGAIER